MSQRSVLDYASQYAAAWLQHELELATGSVLNLKLANSAMPVYDLAGRLYLSSSGWLLLSVPNAFLHGMFSAVDEAGVEKPGKTAHISVMNADEVASIGEEQITERGKAFHYQLGPVKVVAPKTWEGVSKVWYVTVYSPELKQLRASYGLSPLPHGDWDFHITVAIRRSGVLRSGPASKVVGAKS